MLKLLLLAFLIPAIPSTTYYEAPLAPEPPPIVVMEAKHKVVMAEVSAYTSSPDETWGDPFITASGERVRAGIVACPTKHKFGTIVEIEGKEYVCTDRMNARYRDREVYDIWMESKESAYKWGRREVVIKIKNKDI